MSNFDDDVTCPYYDAVRSFLNGLGKTTNKQLKNIINNKETKGSYNIPSPQAANKFFKLYNDCYKKSKVKLAIQENPRTMPYTGIVLDFDVYVDPSGPAFTIDYDKLVREIGYKLKSMLGKPFESRFYVTVKDKTDPDIQLGRYGFHVIIPQVRVQRSFKRTFIKALCSVPSITCFFTNCTNSIENIIDPNLDSNQCYLFGSSKIGSVAYKLHSVYDVVGRVEGTDKNLIILNEKDEDLNLPLLMSILYAPDSNDYETEYDKNDYIEVESDKGNMVVVEQKINTLRYRYPDIDFYIDLIDNIDPVIFSDTASWKTFVKAIANINQMYKPLAIYGSLKCKEEFEKKKTISIIDEIFGRVPDDYEWGLGKLFNWVKAYNPNKIDEIKKKDTRSLALKYAYMTSGQYNDDTLTDLIKRQYSWCYKVTIDTDDNNSSKWYHMASSGLHAYKWKGYPSRRVPDIIMVNIGHDIGEILNHVLVELDKNIGAETGDEKKRYQSIRKSVVRTRTRMGNFPSKKTLVNNLGVYLGAGNEGFYSILDTHKYAIGVNKGILLIPEKPNNAPLLVQSENDYNVSINTGRNYIKYDPENKDIKEVYSVLRDGFYLSQKRLELQRASTDPRVKALSEEYDEESFDYYMFHIARGLAKVQQTPTMLHLYGEGSNMKSLLDALLQSTMGLEFATSIKADYLSQDVPPPNDPHPVGVQISKRQFVAFTETDRGRVMNESKVKWLLSPSECKSLRDMYGKQMQVMFTCVYTSYSNHLLVIEGVDNGIWRRQKYLKIKRLYTQSPDPKKPWEKKENAYYVQTWCHEARICDAYFSILVHYYKRLLDEYGGDISKVPHSYISNKSKRVRARYDLAERFIGQMLSEDENASVSVDQVIASYIKWYKGVDGSNTIIYPKMVREKLKKSRLNLKDSDTEIKGYALMDV